MAHFTLTRANLLAWAPGLHVPDTDFWSLDQKTFKAINGDDGGTWAPAAAIVIGGSGVEITSDLNFTGTGALKGDADIDAGDFQLNSGGGDVIIAADVSITGNTVVEGVGLATLTIGDGVNANELNVEDVAYLKMLFGSFLQANTGSTVQILGSLSLGGATQQLITPLVSSVTGRVVKRFVAVPDANASYDITDGDVFTVAFGLTAARVYALTNVGAQANDIVEFSTRDTNWFATFNGVAHKLFAGQVASTRWFYDGGAWVMLSQDKV